MLRRRSILVMSNKALTQYETNYAWPAQHFCNVQQSFDAMRNELCLASAAFLQFSTKPWRNTKRIMLGQRSILVMFNKALAQYETSYAWPAQHFRNVQQSFDAMRNELCLASVAFLRFPTKPWRNTKRIMLGQHSILVLFNKALTQ